MECESLLVDSAGNGADFVRIEDAISRAKPGAVIRIAAGEYSWPGKLVVNKGLTLTLNIGPRHVNLPFCVIFTVVRMQGVQDPTTGLPATVLCGRYKRG